MLQQAPSQSDSHDIATGLYALHPDEIRVAPSQRPALVLRATAGPEYVGVPPLWHSVYRIASGARFEWHATVCSRVHALASLSRLLASSPSPREEPRGVAVAGSRGPRGEAVLAQRPQPSARRRHDVRMGGGGDALDVHVAAPLGRASDVGAFRTPGGNRLVSSRF